MNDLMTMLVERTHSWDDLEGLLGRFLSDSSYVIEDPVEGNVLVETKQLVDRVGSIKIELYAKEHAPPHFHVKGRGIDATFEIRTCKLLDVEVSGRDQKKIEYWYERARSKLITRWNETRPTDCPVGPIAT